MIRPDHSTTLFIKGLPRGITPMQVAEFFWEKIGLTVSPARIHCKDHEKVASAYIHVTDENWAELLHRNCSDAMSGSSLRVETLSQKSDRLANATGCSRTGNRN